MNPEEKPPSSFSMSQRNKSIRFGTFEYDSDEENSVASSFHQNNPSSQMSAYHNQGMVPNLQSQMSAYHNQGMVPNLQSQLPAYHNQEIVPNAYLVTDISQLITSNNFPIDPNFMNVADNRSLLYGTNSNFRWTEMRTDGSSQCPSHENLTEADNRLGEVQLSREFDSSGNIFLECPQMINPNVQSVWPINEHTTSLPATFFQNVNDTGIGVSFNINASDANSPENLDGRLMRRSDGRHTGILTNVNISGSNVAFNSEADFVSQPSDYHHNIMGRSALNTTIDMPSYSCYSQTNSAQTVVSGIYGDYDLGMMSNRNRGIILGPSYDRQRTPGNDEHHYFDLNSGDLDNVSTTNMSAEFSTLGPANSSNGDPTLSLFPIHGNQAEMCNIGLDLSSGGHIQSSMRQLNMNYTRNMSPRPSMNPGSFENTGQRITRHNLPDQAPEIAHNSNLVQQIWRKRSPAQHPMPISPPQRHKRQADPHFMARTAPLPYLAQTAPSLHMLPSPISRLHPAFSPPSQRNTSPSFAPLYHTSSSQPPSAAQFAPQFSQPPSAAQFAPQFSQLPPSLLSVLPQTSTSLPPLSKGKGIASVLQPQQTFSSISQPSFSPHILSQRPIAPIPRTGSFHPQAYSAVSQPPTVKGASPVRLNRPSNPRRAASAVQTLRRPPKNVSFLHPSHDTLPVFHIKRQDETPGPLGYNCFLCKRDLSFNIEGPISLPPSNPPVSLLRCGHTFHEECLNKITPDTDAMSPPCLPCAVGEL